MFDYPVLCGCDRAFDRAPPLSAALGHHALVLAIARGTGLRDLLRTIFEAMNWDWHAQVNL